MADQPIKSYAKMTQRLLPERLTSIRFPCNLVATCRTGGGKTGISWPAKVRDISTKGTGLVVGRCFAPGTFLTVKLQGTGGIPSTQQAKVIYAHSEGDGHWFLGCIFLPRLNSTELESLLK